MFVKIPLAHYKLTLELEFKYQIAYLIYIRGFFTFMTFGSILIDYSPGALLESFRASLSATWDAISGVSLKLEKFHKHNWLCVGLIGDKIFFTANETQNSNYFINILEGLRFDESNLYISCIYHNYRELWLCKNNSNLIILLYGSKRLVNPIHLNNVN